MAYIELHQSVWTHKKTFVFAAELGVKKSYAVAHLSHLWAWAMDNAPDGDLSDMSDAVIAFGSDWDGDAKHFVKSLIEAGYLTLNKTLHNWEHYGGKLNYRKKYNADRASKTREAAKTSTDKDSTAYVRSTVQGQRREEKRREEENIREYPPSPLREEPVADPAPKVNELFEHFKSKFGKPDMRLSQQQRQKLNTYVKRPKSRSVTELKRCLDNAAADSFYRTLAHKGIEFFIGNETKVEQFLALVPRQQKPAYGSQPQPKPPEPGEKIFTDPDTGKLATEGWLKAKKRRQAESPAATGPRVSSGMAPIGSVLAGVKR